MALDELDEKICELKYLAHFLSARKFDDVISGTAQPQITRASLSSVQFALAPRTEQTRIVAKLEELLSDLDAGVAELKAAQKKLARYRQSLLKAAVEGALTAAWRAQHAPTETGAQLLQRILTERRARWEAKHLAKFKAQGKAPPKDWQKNYPEPVQPDSTGLPQLPERWVWASVEQIVAESSYGTSEKCGCQGKGVPVLRIPNVSGGGINLQDIKFSTTDLKLEKEDYLAVGDVLIIRTNGSIGLVGRAAAVINDLPTPHYFASYLLRLRCIDKASIHRWLLAALSAHSGRQWLETRAASSAGQHNISLSTLLKMPIPLPPIEEQLHALKKCEDGQKAIGQQEDATELSIKQSTAQRQNILRSAFAGQLVPQDPNDEPASVLLERIRAGRAQQCLPSRRTPRPRAPKATP